MKLPFHSGSNKSIFGFRYARKAKFLNKKKHKKHDFSFCLFYSLFFFFHSYSIFPLVASLPLDFVYEVKVFQKALKKVKFFNKKWQVVREDQIFRRFCQSNVIGFSHVNLAQFTGSLLFGHFLKNFFFLLKLVMKNIFYRKRG